MAFLQPENLASRSDVPDRLHEVARHLRDDLPEEVTVWLERTGEGEAAALRREFDGATASGDDGDCYLVVLDPQAGIAVLQAPSRRQIKASRRRRARLDEGEAHRLVVERTKQLGGSVAEVPVESLPVRHVLAVPQTSREHAAEINTKLPLLTRDDFEAGALRLALQRAIGGQILQLGPAEQSQTRAAIKPEIIITGKTAAMFREPDAASEDIIRTLDREQERMARHLGAGYRVIRGVAGSGKTLVLTHRAKHMARNFSHWRILLLCFNRPLASALKAETLDHQNIRAIHIDKLAHQVVAKAGRTGEVEKEAAGDRVLFFKLLRKVAVEVFDSGNAAERYDMVIVDEAQDLGAEGLDMAWAALKPHRDNLLVAHDGAQRIYAGKKRWNPPDMTARGRTTVLKRNYRNTNEILDLALEYLGDAAQRVADQEQPDDFDVLVQPDQAVRHGVLPRLIECDGMTSEVEAALEHVKRLRSDGIPRDAIAILSGSMDFRKNALARIGPKASLDAQAHKDKVAQARNVIRIATLQLLKGLEFPHVVIGGANDIWVEDDEPAEQDRQRRRLLYVAMTRASESLTVTCSGKGIMNAISHLPEMPSAQL